MLVIGEGVNGVVVGNWNIYIVFVFIRGVILGIVVIIFFCREGVCCKVRIDFRSVCKIVGVLSDIFVYYVWDL